MKYVYFMFFQFVNFALDGIIEKRKVGPQWIK